jgi:hypothetical protein
MRWTKHKLPFFLLLFTQTLIVCLVGFQRPLEKTLASKAIGCTASLLPLVWVSVSSVVELLKGLSLSIVQASRFVFFQPTFWCQNKWFNTKGGFKLEDTGKFLRLQHKYSKLLSWAENLNNLFTVLGGKLKFYDPNSDLEYSCWRCKNSPVSPDLKPPLKHTSKSRSTNQGIL